MSTLPAPVAEYIYGCVERRRIERLLVISPDGKAPVAFDADRSSSILAQWRPEQVDSPSRAEARFNMAIVATALEYRPKAFGERVLGRLRDVMAGSVLVVVGPTHPDQDSSWHQADFIALGFRRCPGSRDLAPGWMLFYYDIHDYKITPSWLNSRYWANPERWDKERW